MKQRTTYSLFSSIVCAALFAVPSQASTITAFFDGTVDDVIGSAPSGVAAGDDVSGYVIYSPADAVGLPGPFGGVTYRLPDISGTGIGLTIGDYTWAQSSNFKIGILDGEFFDTIDVDTSEVSNSGPISSFPGSASGMNSLTLRIEDYVFPDLVSSNDIPSSPSDVDVNSATGASGSILGGDDWRIVFYVNDGSLNVDDFPDPVPVVTSLGGNSLFGDTGGKFDPDKPTVAIAHGWQRGGTYTGRSGSVDFLDQMYASIKDEYGDKVNVLLFSWSKAFTGSSRKNYAKPLPFTTDAGIAFGQALSAQLGTDYAQRVHLIGHSYGSVVNISAASELALNGITTNHMTILDAPTEHPVPTSMYSIAADRDWIEYVDNYYGTRVFAFGESIPGTVLMGGYTYDADHSGVWKEYEKSVSSSFCDASQGGFVFSAALGGAGCFDLRPGNLDLELFTSSSPAELDPRLFRHADFDTSNSTLAISTGSDGFAIFDLVVPLFADTLSFDLSFTEPGDGDWLEVLFNDDLLGAYGGTTFGSTVRSLFFDFSPYAGQTGVLKLLLASSGPIPASAVASDFRFNSEVSVAPSPVPVPASMWLLGTAFLGLLAMNRRRRGNRAFPETAG